MFKCCLQSKSCQLRVDMEFPGQPIMISKTKDGKYRATYHQFSVGDQESGYVLHVSGYSGNAGNTLNKSRGQKFTTKDKDQDGRPNYNCAVGCHGGFWYNWCCPTNLNGRWQTGNFDGLKWSKLNDPKQKDLTFVEMKLRML